MKSSFLTAGAWWVELALVMAVGGGLVVGLAAAVGRRIRSGRAQQALWRMCLLGVWALLLLELVGIGPALGVWVGAMLAPAESSPPLSSLYRRSTAPRAATYREWENSQGPHHGPAEPQHQGSTVPGLTPRLPPRPEHTDSGAVSYAGIRPARELDLSRISARPTGASTFWPAVPAADVGVPAYSAQEAVARKTPSFFAEVLQGAWAAPIEGRRRPDAASLAAGTNGESGEGRLAGSAQGSTHGTSGRVRALYALAEQCGAWLGRVWALGTTVLLGWLAWNRWQLGWLRSRLPVMNRPSLARCAHRLARQLGLRGAVAILESRQVQSPVAFGIFRPVLVLPLNFAAEFEAPQQEVMLAHELAHLARRDPLWLLACDALCAVLWWHPAVWLMRQRLRTASELAADESSLLVPRGPEVLADCLVGLARRSLGAKRLGWLSVHGGGFRSALGRRVERLLGLGSGQHDGDRPGVRKAASAALGVLMATVLVFSVSWVHAQTGLWEGETTMRVLRTSWQRWLAALAAAAFLGPAATDAPTAEHPDAPKAVAPKEGERADRPKDAPHDRPHAERPKDAPREGEPRRVEREGRPAPELTPHQRELLERREQLQRQAREIGAQLQRARPDSDDARELRGKLERIRHEIEEISRQLPHREGPRHELREGPRPELPPHQRELLQRMRELEEKARDLRVQLQKVRPDSDDARAIREKLEGLHREMAEIGRQMPKPPRRVEGLPGPRPDLGRLPPEERERRMRHLRAAAENLHAAGMHELAERLVREAEGRPIPPGPPPQPEAPELTRVLHDLTAQVHQLSRQVEELRAQLRQLQRQVREDEEEEEKEKRKEKEERRR